MCNFFSFVTKGSKRYYFNWEQRQQLLSDNPKRYGEDSHTSICAFNKLNDDKVNKYEYNPLTKTFVVDQINIKDDRALAKSWVEKLDFKTIVMPLIIKPVVHPLRDVPMVTEVFKEQIELLKQWASVRDLASVRDSVMDSVMDSVRDSVWASVRDSVWDSVWDLDWDSVWDLDWDWDSVWDSVRDSVLAYTSSFFEISKWKHTDRGSGVNPFQSCIDLWEQGLVPSFDRKTWRLHSGPDGKIVYELKKL